MRLFGSTPRRRVAPRDVSLIDLQTYRVYGPFDIPDFETCARRVVEYLASPHAELVRRSIHRPTATYRPLPGTPADQARQLLRRSAAHNVSTLVTELVAERISDHLIEVTISDEYVGFRLRHAYFDGASGSRYIGDILAVISGEPHELGSRAASARFPLLRGLFRVGLYRPGRAKRSLATMRRYQVELEPGPTVDVRPPRQFRCEPIDAQTARRYTDGLVGEGRRVSVTIGMSMAILVAARSNRLDDRDMSVGIPIDGRKRFVRGRRPVDGNFAPAVGVGSLLETEWTPHLIEQRLEELIAAAVPLLAMVRGVLHDFRPSPFVRQRVPEIPYRLGNTLTLSHLMPTPVYERLPWSSERERHLLVGGDMSQGVGVSIYTERAGNVISVSVFDDSALLDVDGFYRTLFAELGVNHVDTW